MHQKSEAELTRAELAKTIRSVVRLAYSVRADRAINTVLPRELAKFDKALSSGKEYAFSPAELLAGIDAD